MIISVAQLIGDVVGLSNSRFTDSLSVINSYANNDKAMQVSPQSRDNFSLDASNRAHFNSESDLHTNVLGETNPKFFTHNTTLQNQQAEVVQVCCFWNNSIAFGGG